MQLNMDVFLLSDLVVKLNSFRFVKMNPSELPGGFEPDMNMFVFNIGLIYSTAEIKRSLKCTCPNLYMKRSLKCTCPNLYMKRSLVRVLIFT